MNLTLKVPAALATLLALAGCGAPTETVEAVSTPAPMPVSAPVKVAPTLPPIIIHSTKSSLPPVAQPVDSPRPVRQRVTVRSRPASGSNDLARDFPVAEPPRRSSRVSTTRETSSLRGTTPRISSDASEISPQNLGGACSGGATAICADGTTSFSASRRGTCSHHGGVARWCN